MNQLINWQVEQEELESLYCSAAARFAPVV